MLLGHAREKERREGEGEGEGEASNSTLCRLTFFSRPKLASLFNRGKGECNFVTVLSPWQPFQPSLCFTINRGSPRRRPASAALKSCLLLHGILCSPSNNIKYTTKLLNSSDSIDRIWEGLEYFLHILQNLRNNNSNSFLSKIGTRWFSKDSRGIQSMARVVRFHDSIRRKPIVRSRR